MRLLSRKHLLIAGLAALAFLLLVLGIHLSILNSDAYRAAGEWAKRSKDVQAAVGEIRQVDLGWWRFNASWSSGRLQLKFAQSVVGSNGTIELYMETEKCDRSPWAVRQAWRVDEGTVAQFYRRGEPCG